MRTEAKPPLFSSDSVPKNSSVFLSVISNLPAETPPITPSLTVCQSFAASALEKSNRTCGLSSAITNDATAGRIKAAAALLLTIFYSRSFTPMPEPTALSMEAAESRPNRLCKRRTTG